MEIHVKTVADGETLLALNTWVQPRAVHLVNFGNMLLTAAETAALLALHAQWFQQGAQVHYVATRPATRGCCVVAAHSAGDGSCHVASNLAGAKEVILSGVGRVEAELDYFVGDQIVPSFGPPSLGHRLVAMPMDWMGSLQQGFTVPFLANILSTFGIKGLTTLFPMLDAAEKAICKSYGEHQGHLITAFLTLGNGCSFCMYGHLYAANLLLFEETNALGPIGESETERLGQMTDTEVEAFLEERLAKTAWAPLLPCLHRIRALRAGADPVGTEDDMLSHSLRAWTLINECSLQTPLTQAPPFNPRMARNRRLQRAYRSARRSTAA
ncbi:MAG: hypothetical protein CL927_01795 [Deltaproteobacteria bacterium]|nr:hypothetical protein [Deltaproteobacteria bacterium]